MELHACLSDLGRVRDGHLESKEMRHGVGRGGEDETYSDTGSRPAADKALRARERLTSRRRCTHGGVVERRRRERGGVRWLG